MPKYFSILRNIDTKILDEQIVDWFDEHKYSPIILMSPDTLKEIQLKDLGIDITKSTCNNCTGRVGTYEGTKVFSDPSMKYGEVELR